MPDTNHFRRLPGLDGLRAFAVAGVLFYHVALQAKWTGPIATIANRGSFGVTIFFVLSGFLITWLLLREEQKAGGISLVRFYYRRSLRIIPPAYAYLAGVALLAATGAAAVSPRELAEAGLFVRGHFGENPAYTAHYWTLGVEEQFYLIWPALLVALPAAIRISAVASLIVMTSLWRVGSLLGTGSVDPHRWRLDAQAGSLLIGCLLALVRHHGKWGLVVRSAKWQHLAVAMAGIVLLNSPGLLHTPKSVQFISNLCASVAVAVVVSWAVDHENDWVGRVLNQPGVTFVGRLSFSLYIWQQLFCVAGPLRLPWNLLAAFGAATASFYFIERPALIVRDGLGSSLFGLPSVEPTAGPLLVPPAIGKRG